MKTTEALPWEECAARDLPRAETPDGAPLSLKAVEGAYSKTFGMSGFQITIRDAGWELSMVGCIPPGSLSRGPLTIDDGRLVFEVNDASGRPTGKKCAAVPVWWGKTIFLIGRGEVPEFLSFVVNVGRDTRTWASHRILVGGPAGSPEGPLNGHLVLPATMETQILHSRLSGTLQRKDEIGRWQVNFGRAQGAHAGLRVSVRLDSGAQAYLVVAAVDSDSCLLESTESQGPENLHEGLEVWAEAPK